MVEIKKILYPTDFSEHSLIALPYILDLVQKYNAKLFCLYVAEMPNEEYIINEYMVPLNLPIITEDKVIKNAEARLDKFVKENLSGVEKLTTKVIIGTPFVEIVRYAREQSIDMIVIGTHGHSALATMLLGSVAEKVIRKAHCPVLSIRHPKHKFEMP